MSEAAPIKKLRNRRYDFGLKRVADQLAIRRAEADAWLTAEIHQIAHGFLTHDAAYARHWKTDSAVYRYLKHHPALSGKMTVKAFPAAAPPPATPLFTELSTT